jgi:hypothetical protein
VTLLDALRERSSDPVILARAERALSAAMPVGQAVAITPEVLEAMAAGDVAQLVALFAEEVEPEPEELAALAELDREPADRRTLSAAEVRRELEAAFPGPGDRRVVERRVAVMRESRRVPVRARA